MNDDLALKIRYWVHEFTEKLAGGLGTIVEHGTMYGEESEIGHKLCLKSQCYVIDTDPGLYPSEASFVIPACFADPVFVGGKLGLCFEADGSCEVFNVTETLNQEFPTASPVPKVELDVDDTVIVVETVTETVTVNVLTPTAAPRPSKDEDSTGLVILIVVMAVAVIGGGVGFIVWKKQNYKVSFKYTKTGSVKVGPSAMETVPDEVLKREVTRRRRSCDDVGVWN